jgi:hypothetical protein
MFSFMSTRVRLDIVWRTIVDDLPLLLGKLRKILTPA